MYFFFKTYLNPCQLLHTTKTLLVHITKTKSNILHRKSLVMCMYCILLKVHFRPHLKQKETLIARRRALVIGVHNRIPTMQLQRLYKRHTVLLPCVIMIERF